MTNQASQTEPRASGSIGSALDRVRGLLVPGEKLEEIAVQRRIFALTHRRIIVAGTSGRLVIMRRGLFGGYNLRDVRWQDLKDARLDVGMIGANLTLGTLTSSDLAVAGQSSASLAITGLRKDEAQRVYTLCQTHEQQWREKRRIRELEELRAKSGGITLGSAGAALQAGAEPDNAVARLERAREMLDKGLISDAEYEAIKAKLVSSL